MQFAGTIDARKYNEEKYEEREVETKPNFWVYSDDVKLKRQ